MPADAATADAAAAASRASTERHPTAAYIKFSRDVLTHDANVAGAASADSDDDESDGGDTIKRMNVSIEAV